MHFVYSTLVFIKSSLKAFGLKQAFDDLAD